MVGLVAFKPTLAASTYPYRSMRRGFDLRKNASSRAQQTRIRTWPGSSDSGSSGSSDGSGGSDSNDRSGRRGVRSKLGLGGETSWR